MTYVTARINGMPCSAETTTIIYSLQKRLEDNQDYTGAVIAERDALKAEIEVWRDNAIEGGNALTAMKAELDAIKSAPIAGYAHVKTCHYRKHKPEDGYGWVALIRKPE